MKNPTKQDTGRSRTSSGDDRTHPVPHLEESDGIRLAPFEEICGRLIDLQRTEVNLVIQLSAGILEFPVNSAEAVLCEEELQGKSGDRISILRISDPDNPIRVISREQTEMT